MKYNLKNIPRVVSRYWREWSEGFEKELREINQKYNADPYKCYVELGGVEDLIKEILGE